MRLTLMEGGYVYCIARNFFEALKFCGMASKSISLNKFRAIWSNDVVSSVKLFV